MRGLRADLYEWKTSDANADGTNGKVTLAVGKNYISTALPRRTYIRSHKIPSCLINRAAISLLSFVRAANEYREPIARPGAQCRAAILERMAGIRRETRHCSARKSRGGSESEKVV